MDVRGRSGKQEYVQDIESVHFLVDSLSSMFYCDLQIK
jgi:hypothetical protein